MKPKKPAKVEMGNVGRPPKAVVHAKSEMGNIGRPPKAHQHAQSK